MADITRQTSGPGTNAFFLAPNGNIPNNPDLPVLLVRGALPADAGPAAIRRLMESNGWGGTWQYTVFDFHHYHPNAHEALVVAAGRGELVLGGPRLRRGARGGG